MDEDGSVGYSSTGVRALCRLEKKVAPVYEGLTQTPPRKVLGESIYICRSFRLVVKKCDSKFPLGVMSASVEKQSRNFHETTNRPLFGELQKKNHLHLALSCRRENDSNEKPVFLWGENNLRGRKKKHLLASLLLTSVWVP